MIITCPNCHTRYRLAPDALGALGREVKCANCESTWAATPSFPAPTKPAADPEPDDDELIFRADRDNRFTPDDEALADKAFEIHGNAADGPVEGKSFIPGEEPSAPSPAPAHTADQALKRKLALAKRKHDMTRALPIARIRRAARITLAAMIILLGALVVTQRTEIVRAFPDLNSLYSAVGLGTNVIGLEFGDINTLRTTRDGNSVLIVSAKITNTTNRVTFVPPVLVSLVGEDGEVIYEWGVTPQMRNILPGDVLPIDTQLTAPPEGIRTVRLSFVEGQGRTQAEAAAR
ncbi:zinc-ribbon domain-containing protein [Pelagibacterium xiamenense]|uniref:zinc-ribbon domain-containing protein n=1 Tax=Pelagibacterium xiamenense TaxID=2901140 RepID=UPI001E54138D|nr:zinc-ribbon domain-containing protein [Pelagibacterium xiamenense]